MIENWPALLAFIGANVATAASGAVSTPGAWYKTLDKPRWTPPDWLFGPAWTVLFATIIFSGYRFYVDAEPGERTWPLAIYGVQLVLNAAWSALFFGARRIDLALADAGLMLVAIAATAAAFYPVSPTAALVLVPYFLWVSFAMALNYSILRRNAPRRSPA